MSVCVWRAGGPVEGAGHTGVKCDGFQFNKMNMLIVIYNSNRFKIPDTIRLVLL